MGILDAKPMANTWDVVGADSGSMPRSNVLPPPAALKMSP